VKYQDADSQIPTPLILLQGAGKRRTDYSVEGRDLQAGAVRSQKKAASFVARRALSDV